jgi:hypothetical protein
MKVDLGVRIDKLEIIVEEVAISYGTESAEKGS